MVGNFRLDVFENKMRGSFGLGIFYFGNLLYVDAILFFIEYL